MTIKTMSNIVAISPRRDSFFFLFNPFLIRGGVYFHWNILLGIIYGYTISSGNIVYTKKRKKYMSYVLFKSFFFLKKNGGIV